MPLPFFKKNTPSSREYFFALEIDRHTVNSAVWTVVNANPQVLSVSNRVSWDGTGDDSLIQACDRSLTDAAEHVDSSGNTQPQKVILGLPADWIDQEKISPPHLKTLKILTQKLSLTAVGFVVTTEAVVRFLQNSEGTPITALLLGFWPQYLEVTLARLGKIDRTNYVTRSSDVVSDVTEGLSRFSHVDLLPSRILLYDDSQNLEEIKQTLLKHPWQAPQTRLPFLHFPKIEILSPGFTVRAVALAGGGEVIQTVDAIPASGPPSTPPSQSASVADLGFIPEADVAHLPPPQPASPVPPPPLPSASAPARRTFRLPVVSFPRIRFPRLSVFPAPLASIGLIITLGLGLLAAYWFLPTATVVLSVNLQPLAHQFELTAAAQTADVDTTKSQLPSGFLEVTVSDDQTLPATGSKLIGDKAVGSITVINGTSVPRTFPSGTVITSPSGPKFVFDTEIQVASASGTADPNSYQPGKTTAKVTAAQIGSDSNLSAGTQFKIGNFSTLDFVAKNDTAFSGGTSQQVKAVAKDDLASLRSKISDSLKDLAQQELSGKVSASDSLVTESVQLQTVSEELSHKEGEVADEVTLRLSVKARGLVFSKNDLDSLISNSLKPLVPQGFALTEDIRHSFTVKSTGADTVSLNVDVKAFLMPEYDTGSIIKSITGKSASSARDFLSGLPAVSAIEFVVSPRLPAKFLTLPHISDRIKLQIQASP